MAIVFVKFSFRGFSLTLDFDFEFIMFLMVVELAYSGLEYECE